jgi:hypothetical protein
LGHDPFSKLVIRSYTYTNLWPINVSITTALEHRAQSALELELKRPCYSTSGEPRRSWWLFIANITRGAMHKAFNWGPGTKEGHLAQGFGGKYFHYFVV